MKILVINIDDLGLSGSVNKAAELCYASGAVTGSSLIACGNKFDDAVTMLRNSGVNEVGAHLAATGDFTRCSPKIASENTLLDKYGKFPQNYMSFMRGYFARAISEDDIRLEFASQIEKVLDSGLDVTHLDSHEHIHMFPGVLKIIIELARDYDVPYVRLPLEKTGIMRKSFRTTDLFRHAALKTYALRAQQILDASGTRHNSVFWGHFHSGRIDDELMCFIVDQMEEGVNELAVHPGIGDEELLNASPWHSNAPVELRALLKDNWRDKAKERGLNIMTHREAVA